MAKNFKELENILNQFKNAASSSQRILEGVEKTLHNSEEKAKIEYVGENTKDSMVIFEKRAKEINLELKEAKDKYINQQMENIQDKFNKIK